MADRVGADDKGARRRGGDALLGLRIRKARNKRGLSQKALAERIGRSEGWMIQVENGKADPSFGDLRELAAVLKTEVAALILDRPLDANGPQQEPTELDQVEVLRRDLHDALSADALTEASVDDWEQTVLRLGRATRDRPAGLLLADLTVDLAELRRALVRCHSSSTLRRLTRVAAQAAGLVCLTLIKLDQRAQFRCWARTARIAAEEIGDPITYSWVRAQESYGHYYAGDLVYAVDIARHARDLAGDLPCVGVALAAALEARAQAALGRRRETHEALQVAESALARLPADSTIASAFGYNEAQLRFHAGNAFTHLHDTHAAWREQERALTLYPPDDYMDRALILLDRATCLARDGDAPAAASCAAAVLVELTDEQRRGIITQRAREAVALLPARSHTLPAVRELGALLAPPTVGDKAGPR